MRKPRYSASLRSDQSREEKRFRLRDRPIGGSDLNGTPTGITSALFVIESIVEGLLDHGLPAHKIVLLGFSQGACLSSEFAMRHPRSYGGVMALSGGLIGEPHTTWDDVPASSLVDVPVFLGCSDVDVHIPVSRVLETEDVFRRMGASVTRRLYPGMGHLVNEDEIAFVQATLSAVQAAPR